MSRLFKGRTYGLGYSGRDAGLNLADTSFGFDNSYSRGLCAVGGVAAPAAPMRLAVGTATASTDPGAVSRHGMVCYACTSLMTRRPRARLRGFVRTVMSTSYAKAERGQRQERGGRPRGQPLVPSSTQRPAAGEPDLFCYKDAPGALARGRRRISLYRRGERSEGAEWRKS